MRERHLLVGALVALAPATASGQAYDCAAMYNSIDPSTLNTQYRVPAGGAQAIARHVTWTDDNGTHSVHIATESPYATVSPNLTLTAGADGCPKIDGTVAIQYVNPITFTGNPVNVVVGLESLTATISGLLNIETNLTYEIHIHTVGMGPTYESIVLTSGTDEVSGDVEESLDYTSGYPDPFHVLEHYESVRFTPDWTKTYDPASATDPNKISWRTTGSEHIAIELDTYVEMDNQEFTSSEQFSNLYFEGHRVASISFDVVPYIFTYQQDDGSFRDEEFMLAQNGIHVDRTDYGVDEEERWLPDGYRSSGYRRWVEGPGMASYNAVDKQFRTVVRWDYVRPYIKFESWGTNDSHQAVTMAKIGEVWSDSANAWLNFASDAYTQTTHVEENYAYWQNSTGQHESNWQYEGTNSGSGTFNVQQWHPVHDIQNNTFSWQAAPPYTGSTRLNYTWEVCAGFLCTQTTTGNPSWEYDPGDGEWRDSPQGPLITWSTFVSPYKMEHGNQMIYWASSMVGGGQLLTRAPWSLVQAAGWGMIAAGGVAFIMGHHENAQNGTFDPWTAVKNVGDIVGANKSNGLPKAVKTGQDWCGDSLKEAGYLGTACNF